LKEGGQKEIKGGKKTNNKERNKMKERINTPKEIENGRRKKNLMRKEMKKELNEDLTTE
jgi:hypothetical protein